MIKRMLAVVVAMAVMGSILAAGPVAVQAQETVKPLSKSAEPAGVRAGPQNAREEMAVYALLAWAWLCVAVLLWIAGLKIREADRVFRMRLHPFPDKKSSPPRPR
jgi:hypothetical protein